jgi:hypothetical protein
MDKVELRGKALTDNEASTVVARLPEMVASLRA